MGDILGFTVYKFGSILYLTDMPRKARIDAPGTLQHIIVRGIDRRKIFFDDPDREDFCVMLLGDAGPWDERGRDIKKTEDRVLDGKPIPDERPADRRRARVEDFGGGH
jgi:hypothetical protein